MSEATKELEDQIAVIKATIGAANALIQAQREQLIAIWAGSARSGRWLADYNECSPEAEGAEWEPYTEEEQARWLSDGVVPLLERLLFEHDDKGKPIIPSALLAEHGFNAEPEDDTIYPRTNEN